MLKNKKVMCVAMLLGFAAIGTAVYAVTNYSKTGTAAAEVLPTTELTKVGLESVDQASEKDPAQCTKDSECRTECNAIDSKVDCEATCSVEEPAGADENSTPKAALNPSVSESSTVQQTPDEEDKLSVNADNADNAENDDSNQRTSEESQTEVLDSLDEDRDLPTNPKEDLKEEVSGEANVDDPIAKRIEESREQMFGLFNGVSDSWKGNDWLTGYPFLDNLFDGQSSSENEAIGALVESTPLMESTMIQKN